MTEAPVGLSPAWRRWVVENLRGGATGEAVVEALTEHGAPAALATLEVAIIAETLAVLPDARGCEAPSAESLRGEGGREAGRGEGPTSPRKKDASRLERRLGAAARLVMETELPTLTTLGGFHRDFYLANRPALLPGLVRGWAALPQWDLAALAERYGDVDVEFCQGRAADPRCDRNYRQHTTRAPLGEFLARVTAAAAENDLYMISRNRTVRDTPLHALLDTLDPTPEVLDPARMRASSALWIGPAGTVTPMHHDWNNALFFQLRGRKRVRLVSPREPLLHRDIEGVYSPFDPERPDPVRFPGYGALRMFDVTLHPGDALFLPAGWWHHVRALDVSISVSTAAFVWENDASWYTPGRL